MFYLTPNIAVTSVLNPGMRVFDVVVRSDYGTSYNSYTVIGSEGVALIDTAHHNFQDCYFNNVDDSLKGKTPRYLIVNHAEPDHSGAIPDLLGIYPDLTILCTASAAINLKNITNRDDLPIQVVKDGDSISLGDRTLEFMMAPFLHWPDTMFTWCPEEKVLFTCDFLGCHYCEPQYLDSLITYPKAYDKSLEQYFGAIFSPFIEYVQKGLAKIDGLDIEHVCTSHGPILTKGVLLEEVVRRYHAWSDPVKHDVLQVPVFYCTAYGNTAFLAEAIAAGVKDAIPSADVQLCNLTGLSESDLEEMAVLAVQSDAFLIGSPTINRDAVPPVLNMLSFLGLFFLTKRPAAVFGSYGWSGEAVAHISERLRQMKVDVYGEGFRVTFVPTADDLAKAREFGRGFGESLKSLPAK